jgi:hypothetical protein
MLSIAYINGRLLSELSYINIVGNEVNFEQILCFFHNFWNIKVLMTQLVYFSIYRFILYFKV